MSFHIPGLIEVVAIIIIFFIAGFAWAAGSKVFGLLSR